MAVIMGGGGATVGQQLVKQPGTRPESLVENETKRQSSAGLFRVIRRRGGLQKVLRNDGRLQQRLDINTGASVLLGVLAAGTEGVK